MAVLLPSSLLQQHKPPQTPKPTSSPQFSLSYDPKILSLNPNKRDFLFQSISLCIASLILKPPISLSATEAPSSSKSIFSGISNTKSWAQFYGDGFSIRVPPLFEDVNEPEDYNAGASLYGDKVKPKTFAARFSSPDGFEVVSVIIKSCNQLKITFLEAQDITDLGSLKEAAKIFIPGGSSLYSARSIKIKEDEGFRTYYFYEFSRDEQHVALVAAVSGGKAVVAGATAPESKWDDDGVKLRSAALSLTLL